MSARYGIWFATGPEAVVGLTGRLAARLGLEFNANDQEQTVTAVGEGVSWDLSWGHDLEDDRDMALSRYPVVLEFRPWSPMADADHLEAVRRAFDAVRTWGLPAMLLWDAQRLVDRLDGPGDADRRASVLVDLITLRTPLDEALAAVRALPWDSDADLAVVRPVDVRSSLGRFLDGQLAAADVERWADALEVREDVAVDASLPTDLLSTLATADLEAPLTRARAEQLLAVLTDGGGP